MPIAIPQQQTTKEAALGNGQNRITEYLLDTTNKDLFLIQKSLSILTYTKNLFYFILFSVSINIYLKNYPN